MPKKEGLKIFFRIRKGARPIGRPRPIALEVGLARLATPLCREKIQKTCKPLASAQLGGVAWQDEESSH